MKIFQSIFVLLGCLHIAVGPLNCLQIIAWTNMMHEYSDGRSLVEAAEMTLDGEHPCHMCEAIAEAKSEIARDHQDKAPPPTDERQNLRVEFQPLDQPKLSHTARWTEPKSSPPAGQLLLVNATQWQSVPTPPPKARV